MDFSTVSQAERFFVMKAVHVFYEGTVQGVGFRYTVRQIAKGFDVLGWVRNLPDGRVEMTASGESKEVEDFLDAVRTSVLAGHIAAEHAESVAPLTDWKGFRIVG